MNKIVNESIDWVTVIVMFVLALAACGGFAYFAVEFVEMVKAMFS